jgi:hypothetical protein
MFFHKLNFICCDVVDDPTGQKRKTLLGFFGQFQFCISMDEQTVANIYKLFQLAQ